ncbi:MAG: hypothetical protein ACPL4K_03250 [Candidatus Margulisiibacteriota bacterium]
MSPEIYNVMEADLLHLQGRQNNDGRKGKTEVAPSGSKTAAWYRRDSAGTREIQGVSQQRGGISFNNLKKGEGADDALEVGLAHSRGVVGATTSDPKDKWELEGASSNTLRRGEHLPCEEMGKRVETKLNRIAEIAKENPTAKFTTLAYLLNEGFLLRCYRELKDKAAGVDGEILESYGEGVEAAKCRAPNTPNCQVDYSCVTTDLKRYQNYQWAVPKSPV